MKPDEIKNKEAPSEPLQPKGNVFENEKEKAAEHEPESKSSKLLKAMYYWVLSR